MDTRLITNPEYGFFSTEEEEQSYWAEICPVCENRDCNSDCVFVVPSTEKCEDCNGTGRLRFRHRGWNAEDGFVIMSCGVCDGIGLI